MANSPLCTTMALAFPNVTSPLRIRLCLNCKHLLTKALDEKVVKGIVHPFLNRMWITKINRQVRFNRTFTSVVVGNENAHMIMELHKNNIFVKITVHDSSFSPLSPHETKYLPIQTEECLAKSSAAYFPTHHFGFSNCDTCKCAAKPYLSGFTYFKEGQPTQWQHG